MDADLLGNIEVTWNVNSTVAEPVIWIVGTASGQIRVYGSLGNDPGTAVEVQAFAMRPSSAVAVDWDGFHDGHDWASGATVRVEHIDPNDPNSPAAVYDHNTPEARVYRITSCHGDMNNDGSVGFPDITPFVTAISDPAGYAQMLPGLRGA